eukprot:NODE_1013_length_698_cov_563.776579_g641_i2.p1 GENE.NODE_1013_length_698_cov_563.776579_g641_i2~~NODE_1013_length_698_cov_563.776579_g641_i2.p1  ORF type:complete len:198 (-),score=51.31 NODE_1013_length_698_cov_563.776579_g641_i2:104-667(-)
MGSAVDKRFGIILRSVPIPCFMAGPLGLEERKRRTSDRRVPKDRPTGDATRPVQQQATAATSAPAHVDAVTAVKQLADKIQSQQGGASTSLEHVVIDTNSFTKTVENMFHYAFLVRDGRVRMAIDSSDRLVTKTEEPPSAGNAAAHHQCIMRLNSTTYATMATRIKRAADSAVAPRRTPGKKRKTDG